MKSEKSVESAVASGAGWDRGDFNVRLGKRRKRQLLAVAATLSHPATPLDAVDAALACALEGASKSLLVEMDAALAAREEASRARSEALAAEVRSIRDSLEALRALLAALAQEDG